MKETHHLCFTCKNAKTTTAELTSTIYVSYECKYKDVEHHAIVVRLPQTNHIISCPKYQKAPLYERVRRRLFWFL